MLNHKKKLDQSYKLKLYLNKTFFSKTEKTKYEKQVEFKLTENKEMLAKNLRKA